MERCVHKYLYNFVITNHILTPFQSGFVQGDLTTYQLIHTYHAFCESVDNGKEVRTVFCDIEQNRTEQNFIHVDKHVRSLTGDIRYI